MKTKMTIIIAVILVLFAGLFVANNYKNKQAIQGVDNPYGKDNLRQETIDLLDNPLYNNIIVPEALDEKIESGDPVTVYFFSPTCSFCQKTTPIVAPLAEELNIDMKKMNLLEFDKMKYYNIEGTPTIVHYDNGEEIARIVGQQEEDDFRIFFEEFVLN